MVVFPAAASVIWAALAFVSGVDAYSMQRRNFRGEGLTYSTSPSPSWWQSRSQHITAFFSAYRTRMKEPVVGPVNMVLITNVVIVCSCFACIGLCFFFAKPYMFEKPMKNKTAKDAVAKFHKECPKEDKKAFETADFKTACQKLFEQADADGNGILDLKELKKPVQKFLVTHDEVDDEDVAKIIAAFDDDNNGIDMHEFCQMMKYFALKKQKMQEKAAQDRTNKSRAGQNALSSIAVASATNKKYPQEQPKQMAPTRKQEMDMGQKATTDSRGRKGT